MYFCKFGFRIYPSRVVFLKRIFFFSFCFCKQPDSFYFNVLPFAEDVREFQFPSFDNLPSSYHPSEEQQEAADNFVRMLDLAPSGRQEILQPDFTPNPVLEVLSCFAKQSFSNMLHCSIFLLIHVAPEYYYTPL